MVAKQIASRAWISNVDFFFFFFSEHTLLLFLLYIRGLNVQRTSLRIITVYSWYYGGCHLSVLALAHWCVLCVQDIRLVNSLRSVYFSFAIQFFGFRLGCGVVRVGPNDNLVRVRVYTHTHTSRVFAELVE